ncbi:MAG: response regulator [Calditrichae bacterium]|nr:response regulator [Calditrichia bacterium]
MKLIIVEDSPQVKNALKKIFSLVEGIQITGEAENVQTGVELIKAQRPDVVILDFRLPDGTAVDVLNQSKKDEYSQTFIILTNYYSEQYRKACLNAGADYFFHKATEFQKVKQVLDRLTQQTSSY